MLTNFQRKISPSSIQGALSGGTFSNTTLHTITLFLVLTFKINSVTVFDLNAAPP